MFFSSLFNRKYKGYDRDDDRFTIYRSSTVSLGAVSIGVLPLMLSAALFIDPENLSLQHTYHQPTGRLSLGAEPSCSRPPWVKLNRFSSAQPQSEALTIVRSTGVVGATKKPLSTAQVVDSP